MRIYSILLCTFLALLLSTLNCEKKYFYIYEWPDELDDVWPPIGGKLDPHSGYRQEFRGNNGAGSMLDADVGLFNTWQFSLYRNMMARLRLSEYRTRDPEKATSFIIPFDIGVHSFIDHTGKARLPNPLTWGAHYFMINSSKDKKLWWKNLGHDHFILFSTTSYQSVGTSAKVFFMQICQNCTAISIETSPTKTAIKGRTRKYWYAAPYPSSFHWHEGIANLPWEVNGKNNSRDILALFVGSIKTTQPTSNFLRKTIHKQCSSDPNCLWHSTNHTCSGVINAVDTMLLLRRAVFCLAPTGDSLTRKSLFDSLVAGCIPVIFSRASLTQYIWHLSEEDVSKISVYIPMKHLIEYDLNFMHILNALSPEEILMKQYSIAEIAPRLQYSVIPQHAGDGSDGRTWSPPFRDAADVTIDRIIDRNTVSPLHGFSDQELLYLINKQNDILDHHEDYAALRPLGKFEKSFSISKKKEILKGLRGVSKIYTDEMIGYPTMEALTNVQSFIPWAALTNPDIVEYRNGTARYITGSKHGKFGYYNFTNSNDDMLNWINKSKKRFNYK
eukprot:gene4343-6146_t